MNATKSIITIVIIVVLVGLGFRIVKNAANQGATANINVNATSTGNSTLPTEDDSFALTSAAFNNGDSIPSMYTCEGTNTQPPLSWRNAPEGTKSFAITMYDPDVPKQVRPQGFFDHWAIFNIPATTTSLIASSTVGILGNNGSGKAAYTGPCPPSEYEPKEHRYIFSLFALDDMLNLKKGATRADIEKAAAAHTIASTTLIGRYQKVATTTTTR